MQIIEAKNLYKSYFVQENKSFISYFQRLLGKNKLKEIQALKNISFDVSLGESIAFIGRNGAGKSTTIKLLTGILKATNGFIQVLGNDPYKNRQKNNYHIGAVFGQRCQLRWDVSAFESFKLLQQIYNVSKIEFEKTLDIFREILELDKFLYQPVRTLSLGQKMRVELCSAFLHNPKIVFLDEPTIGLDIFSKASIINFLKQIKKQEKTTIFLTTHDTSDIEELCERTIIIEEGQIIFDGLTQNIKSKIDIDNQVYFILENKIPLLPITANNEFFEVKDNQIIVSNVKDHELPQLLNEVMLKNNVKEIKVDSPNFKSILKQFYIQKKLMTKEGT